MREIVIRPATDRDAAFASHVTEISMRVYAEETWGAWDGNVNFDIQFDQVIQFGERDIGLIGVECRANYWFLTTLYVLPAYRNQGIGGHVLERLKDKAKAARAPLLLTVLEVNPARRFYERHGFLLTQTISPRHHMEWRTD